MMEGTSLGNSYYVTLEQDGHAVKYAVTDEVIQRQPSWIFDYLKQKLAEKRKEYVTYQFRDGIGPRVVKATAVRLEPKEIEGS